MVAVEHRDETTRRLFLGDTRARARALFVSSVTVDGRQPIDASWHARNSPQHKKRNLSGEIGSRQPRDPPRKFFFPSIRESAGPLRSTIRHFLADRTIEPIDINASRHAKNASRRVSIPFSSAQATTTLLSPFSSSPPSPSDPASLSPLFRAGFTSDELDRRQLRDLSTGSRDSLLFHIVSCSSPSRLWMIARARASNVDFKLEISLARKYTCTLVYV